MSYSFENTEMRTANFNFDVGHSRKNCRQKAPGPVFGYFAFSAV